MNELHRNRQVVRVRVHVILRRRPGSRAVDSVEVAAGPVLHAVRGNAIGVLDLICPVDVGSRRTDVARRCECDRGKRQQLGADARAVLLDAPRVDVDRADVDTLVGEGGDSDFEPQALRELARLLGLITALGEVPAGEAEFGHNREAFAEREQLVEDAIQPMAEKQRSFGEFGRRAYEALLIELAGFGDQRLASFRRVVAVVGVPERKSVAVSCLFDGGIPMQFLALFRRHRPVQRRSQCTISNRHEGPVDFEHTLGGQAFESIAVAVADLGKRRKAAEWRGRKAPQQEHGLGVPAVEVEGSRPGVKRKRERRETGELRRGQVGKGRADHAGKAGAGVANHCEGLRVCIRWRDGAREFHRPLAIEP
jgi:hypothetical protein